MKDFFAGCDGWVTGIEALDAQHVGLAACINEVAAACGSASRQWELPDLVADMHQQTKAHFEYEEAVMQAAEYPGFAAHRREHVMLLAELKLAINKASAGTDGIKVDSEMVEGLKTWFMAHVKHSDCQFSTYIASRKSAPKLNAVYQEKTLAP